MSKSNKKVKGKGKQNKKQFQSRLPRINPDAAGIDIGATEHYVAVPPDRDANPIRHFGAFTADLNELANWLERCGIKTVAMESTGVYWIPLFQILETQGFQVQLVNARQVKSVPGRKTDVSDCEWLQLLHSYGLLSGSFRPTDQICKLRSYLRHRDSLVQLASTHIQHMQKALNEMNIQLHHVLSDLTGVTGLAILDAILAGERDTVKLAQLRDRRVRSSAETITKALEGDYRVEHLFVLQQSLQAYRFYQAQIRQLDQQVEALLAQFDSKVDLSQHPVPANGKQSRKRRGNEPAFDLRSHLYRISGVDLTQVDGLNLCTVQTIFSEIGTDMGKWPTEKHFVSWLGLCPDNRISGGKLLQTKTRHVVNRAAGAFRMAAQSLKNSATALGAFYRRMRARLGAPKAITATAHKLARIVYRLLRYGEEYVDAGERYYEERYRKAVLKNLLKRANSLGYELVLKPIAEEVS